MRLFLALIPSPSFRETIGAWQEGFRREAPGCRPVPPERLHMTLLFEGQAGLKERTWIEGEGDRFFRKMDQQEVSLPSSRIFFDSRTLPGLGILSFGTDPPDRPPRREIAELMEEDGKGRRFWPHMTLFRRFYPVRKEIRPLPEAPDARFSDLVLFESVTNAGGPVYRPLRRWSPGLEGPVSNSHT